MTGDELGNAARKLFGQDNPRAIRMLAEALGIKRAVMAKMVKGKSLIYPETDIKVRQMLDSLKARKPRSYTD